LAARLMSGRTLLLTALAAKVLNRPVHFQLTRAQMYSMVGHQPASVQTIALGATSERQAERYSPYSISPTACSTTISSMQLFAPAPCGSATGGIATNHKIVHVNRNTPTALRAPHEALGHFALESALDELAYATGVIRFSCACSTILRSTRTLAPLLLACHAQVPDRRGSAVRLGKNGRQSRAQCATAAIFSGKDGRRNLHPLALARKCASHAEPRWFSAA